jgi:hypothetical protein
MVIKSSVIKSSLLNSAASLPSINIEKRIAEAEQELRRLQTQLTSVGEERALWGKSGEEITEDGLAKFEDREEAIGKRIERFNKILRLFRGQLYDAHYAEWHEEKIKRKAELEERNGAPAEKRRSRIDELRDALAKEVSEDERDLHEAQSFNRTTNEDVGYVVPATLRLRRGSPSYIWDQLRRAGIQVPMLKSAVVELPPPQAPTPQPQRSAAGGGPGSAVMNVIRTNPETPPAADTDFHGRSLVRTADDARTANEASADAAASQALIRDTHQVKLGPRE